MSVHAAMLLAVIAASGMSIGAVFQKKAAERLPKLGFPPSFRQLSGFFCCPSWLLALFVSIGSWIGYLFALANAPVSLIHPLLGLGLAVLALFSVLYLKEKISAGEWAGIATLIAGLVLLGLSAEQIEKGNLETISYIRLVSLSAGLLVLVGLIWLVEKSRPGTFNLELLIGAASGILIGIGALLTRAMLLERRADHLLVFWGLLALVIGLNMAAIFIQQAGFQRGRAMTVTAALTILNKLIAVVGGFLALGEGLPESNLKRWLRISALLALLAGTALLSSFGPKGKNNK